MFRLLANTPHVKRPVDLWFFLRWFLSSQVAVLELCFLVLLQVCKIILWLLK